MRKIPFVPGEHYHAYNRGTDKRIIFSTQNDVDRFIQSMEEFNVVEPIGSIYENSFIKNKLGNETSKSGKNNKKLVNIIAYCLNPNHFHLILEEVTDSGISNFMKRLGGGYTKYYNAKQKRSGCLFQGVFKSVHIDSNKYLLHLSVYVNLNDRVHQLGNETSRLVKSKSSWAEYTNPASKEQVCKKDIILEQFKNIEDYKKYAIDTLKGMIDRKKDLKGMEGYLLE